MLLNILPCTAQLPPPPIKFKIKKLCYNHSSPQSHRQRSLLSRNMDFGSGYPGPNKSASALNQLHDSLQARASVALPVKCTCYEETNAKYIYIYMSVLTKQKPSLLLQLYYLPQKSTPRSNPEFRNLMVKLPMSFLPTAQTTGAIWGHVHLSSHHSPERHY